MTSDFFRNWPTTIRRAAYESAFPLLGGGAWVAWSWFHNRPFFEALSGFGIGYLFVLSVQGQILRINKNVRDETDAEEFRGSFQSIHQALAELRMQRPIQDPTSADRVIELPLTTRFSLEPNALFEQAKQAAEEGHYYASVLLAAVGYERALRDTAARLDIDAERVPIAQIIRNIVKRIPEKGDEAEHTLGILWRLRNSFVHAQTKGIYPDIKQALEFIDAFKDGAAWMSEAIPPRRHSP